MESIELNFLYLHHPKWHENCVNEDEGPKTEFKELELLKTSNIRLLYIKEQDDKKTYKFDNI